MAIGQFARSLGIGIGFGVNDKGLIKANRRVDEFKNKVNKSSRDLTGLESNAKRAGLAISTAFKGATNTLSGGVAVLERYRKKLGMFAAAGAAAIGKAVKDAGNANEIVNKFNVVFKQFAGETRSWAEEYSGQIGRSKYATMEWLSSFQDVVYPMGFAREEATNLSKELVTLAADLGSFNKVSTSDAAARLQSALIGNLEAVRGLGITIDADNVKMYAYQHGIAKTGEELTNMQKAQARMGLFIERSSDAIGDATRTADSFNNQWQRFMGNIRDISIGIGNVFLPSFRKALVSVNKFLDVFKESKKLKIAAMILGITTVTAGLGAAIGFVSAAVAALEISLLPFIGIAAAVALGVTGIVLVVQDLWTGLHGGKSRLLPLINSFLEFIGVGCDFKDVIHGIGTGFKWLWGAIKSYVKFYEPLFKDVFGGITNILQGTLKLVWGFLELIVGGIRGLITGDFTLFQKGLEGFYEGFYQMFGGIAQIVGGAIKFIYDKFMWLINWFSNIEWKLPTIDIGGWWDRLKEGFSKIDFGGVLKSAIEKATDNLPGWMQKLAGKMMNFLPQSPAKEGPLKNLDKVGPGLVGTIATGIDKNSNKIDTSLADMWSGGANQPVSTEISNSTLNNSTMNSSRQWNVNIENLYMGSNEPASNDTKAKMERIARETFNRIFKEEYTSAVGDVSG